MPPDDRVVADEDSWIHMRHLVDIRHLFRELGSLFSNYVKSQIYFSEKSVSRHASRQSSRQTSRYPSKPSSRIVSRNMTPTPHQLKRPEKVGASLRRMASETKMRLGTPSASNHPMENPSEIFGGQIHQFGIHGGNNSTFPPASDRNIVRGGIDNSSAPGKRRRQKEGVDTLPRYNVELTVPGTPGSRVVSHKNISTSSLAVD